MKYAVHIVRTLLGLGFCIFGANILHPFLPMPMPPPDSMQMKFMSVMMGSGWMSFIGAMQLLGGLLLVTARMAPLGITILAPILVNILCYHTFVDGGAGIAPGLVFSLLEAFLIYAYWGYFRGLVTTNAQPRGSI